MQCCNSKNYILQGNSLKTTLLVIKISTFLLKGLELMK